MNALLAGVCTGNFLKSWSQSSLVVEWPPGVQQAVDSTDSTAERLGGGGGEEEEDKENW